MPQAQQWARTRVRTSRQVRRGAWYRVVRVTPIEAVLEVNGRHVKVPCAFLQILPFRPTQWSVVTRLRGAAHPPASWGSSYGVCPSCSGRAPLVHQAVSVKCPHCEGVFGVAWADSGWCAFEARRGAEPETALQRRRAAWRRA
jgi:hypothetical protein